MTEARVASSYEQIYKKKNLNPIRSCIWDTTYFIFLLVKNKLFCFVFILLYLLSSILTLLYFYSTVPVFYDAPQPLVDNMSITKINTGIIQNHEHPNRKT